MRQPFVQRHPGLVTWLAPSVLEAPEDYEDRWPWQVERVELEPITLREHGEDVPAWEVVSGHVTVAHAIVDAALAHNAIMVLALVERWLEAARHADDQETSWRKGWERQLSDAPGLRDTLEESAERVLAAAGFSRPEIEVFELSLEGLSHREIARRLDISRNTVRDWLDEGVRRLRAFVAEQAPTPA